LGKAQTKFAASSTLQGWFGFPISTTQRFVPVSIDGEAVEQARAARGDQIFLAAPSAWVRRVRRGVAATGSVRMASWAVPVPLLVQSLQVWSALSEYALPSVCEPLRIS